MNMAKVRQILELRRATKAPPLIPPKAKTGDGEPKKGPSEVLDVHLNIRNFAPGSKSKSDSVVLIFSESDDSHGGPWRVTTASELLAKSLSFDLNSVFAVEFQLERYQYIRLDICDWRETSAVSLGYAIFSVSELVIQPDCSIAREVIDDDSGLCVATALISCSLRPKPHSVLLQFYAKNLTNRKNMITTSTQIFFEVRRIGRNPENGDSENTDPVLYRSETAKFSTKSVFRTFFLQSPDIINSVLEITLYYRDSKNPRVVLGSFETKYELLKKGQCSENVYSLCYEGTKNQLKSCGDFELLRFNEMTLPSFLEFITAGTTVNLAFAVDLTQSELAVDGDVVRRYVADVELAIRAISEPLRNFNVSNTFAAFGFGAKIPPHFRESQEFCLNLETDPYCRGVDGVLDAFRTAFANTQSINTAHLSHVIYYVSKLAQNLMNRSKNAVYHILVVITRGVFDDIKETVQALIFASRAPISVIFVGVGEMDLTELSRLGTAGTRLNFHGRKPERDCGQFVSVPKCREEEPQNNAELRHLIAERALVNIPWQMTTWMSKNGVKPDRVGAQTPLPYGHLSTALGYSWQPPGAPPQTPPQRSPGAEIITDSSPSASASTSDRTPADRFSNWPTNGASVLVEDASGVDAIESLSLRSCPSVELQRNSPLVSYLIKSKFSVRQSSSSYLPRRTGSVHSSPRHYRPSPPNRSRSIRFEYES